MNCRAVSRKLKSYIFLPTLESFYCLRDSGDKILLHSIQTRLPLITYFSFTVDSLAFSASTKIPSKRSHRRCPSPLDNLTELMDRVK